MKESYRKGQASHLGPESCLDDPRGRGEALTGERGRSRGQAWELVREAEGVKRRI